MKILLAGSVKYLLYLLTSLAAIGLGFHLHLQITSGSLFAIVLSILACILILASLFCLCKGWYYTGKVDAAKEILKRLEEVRRETDGLE